MDDYTRLRSELEQMPGHRILLENYGLNNSIHIFDGNYAELKQILDFMETDDRSQEILTPEGRDKLQAVNQDIIRLLHNFVAATMSLIEHTRRLYQLFFKPNNKFPDYQVKIDEMFRNHPLSQFVQKLRVYCQHYKSPNIIYTTSFNSGTISRRVCLRKSDLLSFDEWQPVAKKFLASSDSDIWISEIVEAYRNRVIEFYQWYQSCQFMIHEPEISAFKSKQTELLLMQLDIHLSTFAANIDFHPRNPDIMFSYILSEQDYKNLVSIPENATDRADTIIQLVDKYLALPEQIKEKIRIVYLHKNP